MLLLLFLFKTRIYSRLHSLVCRLYSSLCHSSRNCTHGYKYIVNFIHWFSRESITDTLSYFGDHNVSTDTTTNNKSDFQAETIILRTLWCFIKINQSVMQYIIFPYISMITSNYNMYILTLGKQQLTKNNIIQFANCEHRLVKVPIDKAKQFNVCSTTVKLRKRGVICSTCMYVHSYVSLCY